MPQSFVLQLSHIVFSTKQRYPLISTDWEEALYKYIGGITRSLDSRLLEIGGTSDHLHLLASLNKSLGIAEFVRKIKCGSSKWMHDSSRMRKFCWQKGYERSPPRRAEPRVGHSPSENCEYGRLDPSSFVATRSSPFSPSIRRCECTPKTMADVGFPF